MAIRQQTEREGFHVAMVNPFWRYAVGPERRADIPAVPFFSRAAAEAFYAEVCEKVPWDRPVMLRRRPFGRVEVVK